MATITINTDLSGNKLRSGPQNPKDERFEDSLQANYTSSETAEKLANQIIEENDVREHSQNPQYSFLLQAAQQRCEEIQARAYKGTVRLDQLDKIAHNMYQIPSSTPTSARHYNHDSNQYYSPHHHQTSDSSSPLTSAQYRVSSYSVLKGKPSMGGHYMTTEPPLSFIYYKDKAEKYYSTTNGFKFTQRPKSAGSNFSSRGLLKNYYVHENHKDKRDIAVIGNEITADSQAHVHRLLCNESRLFASRPPSPVASVVNSVIKAQQTDPEAIDPNMNKYGSKGPSEEAVAGNQNNQDDFPPNYYNLMQQSEMPRPRKTLEMYIPQVEKDPDAEEESPPPVNNKQQQNNHQSTVAINGEDPSGEVLHTEGAVEIEDIKDCELLDYQKIDWENADLLPDPESLTLDALLSPLDMGPSLREVTNAYAHNLFRRQTDPTALRDNSQPFKGYSRVPSLGVRSFNNVKPGYSSIDRTRQMRPPKPETKRVVSETNNQSLPPNGSEKINGLSDNGASNEKELSRKTSTSDLRSASSLSIASLTFFDDLNPENNQDHASVNDHINSHRSSYSILNNRTKSASAASAANSRKNGVIRKQAKLRGITGIEIANNSRGSAPEKSYAYDREFVTAAEQREPAQKKVTTITFGSKDTVLENGYILQTINRGTDKQNAQSAYNSYARPKTASATPLRPANIDSSTNMPMFLKAESSGIETQSNSMKADYSAKSKFPNRSTQQASKNMTYRVKSAPLATSNRTVVKVQYEPDTELGSLVLFSTKEESERVPNTRHRSRPSSSKATRVNCQNNNSQHIIQPQTTQTNTTPNLTPRPVFKPLSSATDRSRTHLVQQNNNMMKPNATPPHRAAVFNNS